MHDKCFHCEYMKATIKNYTHYEIFLTICFISCGIKLSVTLADARHISRRALSNIIYDITSLFQYILSVIPHSTRARVHN